MHCSVFYLFYLSVGFDHFLVVHPATAFATNCDILQPEIRTRLPEKSLSGKKLIFAAFT